MSDMIKNIIYSLHPLERDVLKNIKEKDVSKIASKLKLKEEEVVRGALLLEERGLVYADKIDEIYVGLDKFGEKYIKSDLPEVVFLKEILDKKKKKSELKISDEEFSSALGVLKRNGLVHVEKGEELEFSVTKDAKKFLETQENELIYFEKEVLKNELSPKQKEIFEKFKLRKGFLREFQKKSISFRLSGEGEDVLRELKSKFDDIELADALTSDMLKDSSWKGKEFRHYDVNLKTTPGNNLGRRHPMIEANNILRDVFVEMGFKEMQGPMVESAFWNMDTMWIPQDHPAREEQDTFYLEGSAEVEKDIMNKVKKMHEEGLKRTHTQVGEWSEEITKKRLLRTHSTATTFRTLAELGKKFENGEDVNGKYFYVANNFRNEAVDATHLAEFYQAEGFIIGDNLSLADLMGFIKGYYGKLGIEKIKFKPTFNPYTEPSMEAHYYDPKMKKWYALINSGIFRPETLEPLGLRGKTIIAWGMGASRVATLLANVDSMRDLTGYTCDFDWLRKRPVMKREIVRK